MSAPVALLARTAFRLVVITLLVGGCVGPGRGGKVTDANGAQSGFADFATTPEQGRAWQRFVAGIRDKWRGKTLRVISRDDNYRAGYERLVPRFEQLTGAKVETTWYPYDTTYLLETFLGNSQSTSPDIFIFDMVWVGKFAESKYVEPLNSYLVRAPEGLLDYSDFFQVMSDGAIWEGTVTGLPFAPYFAFNIYNKKLLRKAGVRPPRHLDDLVQVARAVSSEVADGYGVAMNNQTGTAVGQAYFEYIYNMGGKPFASEYPGSPDYYADMTPQFTSPESIAVVELFRRLLPYQPPGKMNFAWAERFETFASGRAALMTTWNFNISPLLDPAVSAVANEFAVQPALHKKGVPLNTPVGGWEMGINRHSINKDLAWDFMLWFSSPQIGTEFAAVGGFPTRYSALTNPDLVRQFPYYQILRETVDTSFPGFRPQIPESFDVIEALGTWIAKALYGELSTKEAMARANEEVGLLLKEAGYPVRGL